LSSNDDTLKTLSNFEFLNKHRVVHFVGKQAYQDLLPFFGSREAILELLNPGMTFWSDSKRAVICSLCLYAVLWRSFIAVLKWKFQLLSVDK